MDTFLPKVSFDRARPRCEDGKVRMNGGRITRRRHARTSPVRVRCLRTCDAIFLALLQHLLRIGKTRLPPGKTVCCLRELCACPQHVLLRLKFRVQQSPLFPRGLIHQPLYPPVQLFFRVRLARWLP